MGRSVNNSHSFLLANSAVVSTIFKDGGTQHSTSGTESAPQTAKITRKDSLSIILQLIAARSSRVSKWKDCNQASMMSQGVNDVIITSWTPGTKAAYNRPVQI